MAEPTVVVYVGTAVGDRRVVGRGGEGHQRTDVVVGQFAVADDQLHQVVARLAGSFSVGASPAALIGWKAVGPLKVHEARLATGYDRTQPADLQGITVRVGGGAGQLGIGRGDHH